jgi:hypothetical protein
MPLKSARDRDSASGGSGTSSMSTGMKRWPLWMACCISAAYSAATQWLAIAARL